MLGECEYFKIILNFVEIAKKIKTCKFQYFIYIMILKLYIYRVSRANMVVGVKA